MQVDSFQVLGPPAWPWRAALGLRGYLESAYSRHVPAPALALVLSTVLGDMSGLSRDVKRDFQNTGMMHILAISGQHIALMAAIGIQAFRMALLPQRTAYAFIALGLAFYGPATGWSPSVVRSIAMFWLLLPAILLRRPHSPWTTLAASAAISLFFEPTALLQVGWQLSYLATLTLLLHLSPSEKAACFVLPPRKFSGALSRILRLGLSASILSFAVTLGTLPIIAAFSHVLMPIAPLANLITVPVGSGLLTCAFLTAAFSPIPILGDLLGEATGGFALALQNSVGILARWQSGLMALSSWPLILGFAWVTCLLLWPFFTARLRFRAVLAAMIFGAGLHAWKGFVQSSRQPVAATVLDVGQGQAVILEMGGQILLVDAGPARPDAGLRSILPALRAKGRNRIDLVLLSHGDADHIGGLLSLAHELQIGRVALGGPWPADGLWPDLVAVLRQKNIPLGALIPGQTLLESGSWKLRTLDLGLDESGVAISRNDASAVVVLEGPTGRLLIPGDIGQGPKRILADTVKSWSAHGPDKPLWLVIPHHGSDRTGDMPALLAMRPDIALISAGKKNKFGHPGPKTLATLRSMGTEILLTPRHGALSLAADKHAARWTTVLGM